MRALLVDDDHELARLLTEYLGPHGVSSSTFRRRWGTLSAWRTTPPTTSCCST